MSDEKTFRGEVDATALREAIVRLARMGRRGANQVVMQLTPLAITIEWGGNFEELAAEGQGSGLLALAPGSFTSLPQALPRRGAIAVSLKGATFCVAEKVIPCELQELPEGRTSIKPVGPLELLLMHFQRSEAEVAEAGLTEKLDALRERARRSVLEAAESLSWLAIDAPLLAAWVEAHLDARAKGQRSFELGPKTVVVDQQGQSVMFDPKS